MHRATQRYTWRQGLLLVSGLLALAYFTLYTRKDTLVVLQPVPMLEHPWPLDYPSTRPFQNRIVTILREGTELEIDYEDVEKDYRYFRVKHGMYRGYVIDGSEVTVRFWLTEFMERLNRDR